MAHNARFDQRFLERQLSGHQTRLAEPPLCTAALARRLLEGRVRGVSLASLADFFGVPTHPCHRALPDAEATAQVLIHLIGLAQEIGARTLSELRTLAAPRKRTCVREALAGKRGADPAPGCICSATGTGRCSTSAAPATSAPVCGPISAASASVRR